jgi:DNA mismatch repair protein MutL
LAFARHATSKLTDVSDLDHIATLGFRGEALASIAAVSWVTLLSRPREQAVGQYLRVEGGEIVRQEGRGSPAGTVVTVEHLFRSVPARLKFLRQPQTEAGHIHSIVTNYALAYPDLRFSLTQDDRSVFQSGGSGRLYDVLIALYGLDLAEQLLEIEDEVPSHKSQEKRPAVDVSGYVSAPALHRANRRYITLFVNQRWIQDNSLSYAVVQAYQGMLPVGRHPLAVVLLEMDPGELDVNVHPTKREVRFRNGRQAFSAVQRAVRKTLVEQSPVPNLGHQARSWTVPDQLEAAREWQRRQSLMAAGRDGAEDVQIAMQLQSDQEELQPIGPVRLPLLRVVGQVGQTYIVAEGPQGMYLIDQHAAHERILYEKMVADHARKAVTSQTLLEPVTLDLDPVLTGVLGEQVLTLNQVGFALEPFGRSSYLLRAVPSILAAQPSMPGSDARGAMVDILEMLQQGKDPLAAQAEERLIAAVCKRAAVKAGQTLSAEEMEQLVRQLEQCESPRTCPHGRPTVLHFSAEQLEKEFGRR